MIHPSHNDDQSIHVNGKQTLCHSSEARMSQVKNLQLSREQRIVNMSKTPMWDLVVVGGGITGAGILKLASQAGLKVLLLEQKDYAWGSSSRSSKMVHGGLRYMAQGQIGLTKESVIERQRLLAQGYPLVTKQSFVMSHYQHAFPGVWVFNRLLSCYDFIAGVKQHKFWPQIPYLALAPNVDEKKLLGGTQFYDAITDDARLVQRLIQESLCLGGDALNYAKVVDVAAHETHQVLKMELAEQVLAIKTKVVVNACGAWSKLGQDSVKKASNRRTRNDKTMHLRPLRGSHLLIPSWRLPVGSVFSIRHAQDKRPVQVYPWQNVTLVGTTDVEHSQDMEKEAHITQDEFDYLLAAIAQQFPNAKITPNDVISTFSGVRPVITSGESTAPSKEKREHFIEQKAGVIWIAGGKLTTFRLIAKQVLTLVCQHLTSEQKHAVGYHQKEKADYLNALELACKLPVLSASSGLFGRDLGESTYLQISACYGELSELFVEQSDPQHCFPIRYSRHLWAELIWAVKFEQVQHLDDLLLRRTRIGNVLPMGAQELLPKIKQLCAPYLSWSEERWQQEVDRYCAIWHLAYSLPNHQDKPKKLKI
ncbi:glycerol-3-phosphate dehydrogenase/oxidase [Thalassotalea atypica]|uniref:glycerol-3-phosphate dehydrogenase/oxidase n=1 Tax=Thalassotalea atypica TaxID=2054316 RepID=UPI00257480C1|nr:glycerol-3-phosphate dehydrogenase/oxidase [Thalassotalea atypica]